MSSLTINLLTQTSIEDVYDYVGGVGWYQILLLTMASYIGTCQAFGNNLIIFTQAETDHRCLIPEYDLPNNSSFYNFNKFIPVDSNNQISSCTQYQSENSTNQVPCQNGYVYDTSVFQETITSEFDLVCQPDRQFLQILSISIFYFGYRGFVTRNIF